MKYRIFLESTEYHLMHNNIIIPLLFILFFAEILW